MFFAAQKREWLGRVCKTVSRRLEFQDAGEGVDETGPFGSLLAHLMHIRIDDAFLDSLCGMVLHLFSQCDQHVASGLKQAGQLSQTEILCVEHFECLRVLAQFCKYEKVAETLSRVRELPLKIDGTLSGNLGDMEECILSYRGEKHVVDARTVPSYGSRFALKNVARYFTHSKNTKVPIIIST